MTVPYLNKSSSDPSLPMNKPAACGSREKDSRRSAEEVLQNNSFHCFSQSEARAIVGILKREGLLVSSTSRRIDGKYDFSNTNLICECGARLGDHIAEYPHENESTNCKKFNPAPVSSQHQTLEEK